MYTLVLRLNSTLNIMCDTFFLSSDFKNEN